VAKKRQASEPETQLSTRMPPALRQRLRVHCVTRDVTVTEFVVAAIRERLGRDGRPRRQK
jgi:hypothetical protein